MKKYRKVSFVVNKLLCTSCGTCAGVCPEKSINMIVNKYGIYVPRINENTCTNCGICVKVCPGHEFDYVKYNKRIHGKIPDHVALGVYKNCYAGYTKDEEILKKSQSGGFVSTILIYCLENNLIDGAVVSRWKSDPPIEPETYIARNREEVLAAVGSKYNPVPASQIVGDILASEERLAFVGTSCQIQGLRLTENIYPQLKEKIKLYIGLHCLGVFTYHFHDQMLYKINLKKRDLAYFRHRSKEWKGWPCDMRMIDKKGKVYDIDANNSRLWPRPFFTSWRCQLCFDKANEFSDISCGDCRIPEMYDKVKTDGHELKKGLSEWVIRTNRGSDIFNKIINDNKFVIYETDENSIAKSIGVAGKKLGINTFTKIASFFGKGIPKYNVNFPSLENYYTTKRKIIRTTSIITSSRYYISFVLARFRLFRFIYKKIPHSYFKQVNFKCTRVEDWSKHKSASKIKMFIPKNEVKIHQKIRNK